MNFICFVGSNDDSSYPEHENSHIQPVYPAPPMMAEYFIPHTQLELGQTIVRVFSLPIFIEIIQL